MPRSHDRQKRVNKQVSIDDVRLARSRIMPHLKLTELLRFDAVSKGNFSELFLKLESEQVTGSFKARGSMNKVLSLSDAQRTAGVITASTGNHGLGVANACRVAGVEGTVFLPHITKPAKAQLLRDAGIQLEFVHGTSLETELHAKEVAGRTGKVWISPYNDPEVIAGQGTIGLELLEQLDNIDAVYITVGGGGLMSGIAVAIKTIRPDVRIVGCQPANSPEMTMSIRAGQVVDVEGTSDTLSDGSAGPLEHDSITFGYCQELVDEWILISETDIARAMANVFKATGKRIEGSAGVAVAGAQMDEADAAVRVAVICGGNISADRFRKSISGVTNQI